VADFRGLWGLPPNARIVSDNNPGHCFDELISSVGALARQCGGS
jgi:purine nucleosidase